MKALLGSKFDVRSFEAKNRVFECDYQQMNMFEFVRCSKNDVRVRSMFDKMVFDPSLSLNKKWKKFLLNHLARLSVMNVTVTSIEKILITAPTRVFLHMTFLITLLDITYVSVSCVC